MAVHLNGKVHREPAPHWELRLVDARSAEFKRHWPRVREGVEGIIEHYDGWIKFIPEEVYVSLYRRWSFLYLAIVDGVVEGWGILQNKKDENGDAYLLNWLGQSDTTEAKDLYYAEIARLAKEKGFKSIRQYARIGFLRNPPPGWKTVEITQELRLDEEV
jgi:hypothetical protein